jgi:DNA invertase Pin-like site-specific DNA recombinase
MKMSRGSRPWCTTILIFKGATHLPCQRLWLEVSYVHCAILTSGIRSRTYPSFLFQSYSDPIDVVLVWRYDRFARSTQALVHALKEFHRLGVDFISFQENIDTTTPQGEMIFTVMASLAQFESALTSERVKAGMARAKAQGKQISRAPIAKQVQERIAELHAQGLSIQQIRKQLRIAYGTAWNYVQRLKASAGGIQ